MRLIDADALKEGISDWCDTLRGTTLLQNQIVMDALYSVMDDIDHAPTIAAKPVQYSKWLEDRPHHYCCACCGDMWGNAARVMRYCPHCGAKMALK